MRNILICKVRKVTVTFTTEKNDNISVSCFKIKIRAKTEKKHAKQKWEEFGHLRNSGVLEVFESHYFCKVSSLKR